MLAEIKSIFVFSDLILAENVKDSKSSFLFFEMGLHPSLCNEAMHTTFFIANLKVANDVRAFTSQM